MATEETHWLAGLLEGEGSFGLRKDPAHYKTRKRRAMVQFASIDEDVVERVAQIWGVAYHHKPNKNTPMFAVRVTGDRVVGIMEDLRPLMGVRRKAQIDAAIEGHRSVV